MNELFKSIFIVFLKYLYIKIIYLFIYFHFSCKAEREREGKREISIWWFTAYDI